MFAYGDHKNTIFHRPCHASNNVAQAEKGKTNREHKIRQTRNHAQYKDDSHSAKSCHVFTFRYGIPVVDITFRCCSFKPFATGFRYSTIGLYLATFKMACSFCTICCIFTYMYSERCNYCKMLQCTVIKWKKWESRTYSTICFQAATCYCHGWLQIPQSANNQKLCSYWNLTN